MSLEVSKVIKHVQEQPGGADIPGNVIATALALICGAIVLVIGLLRLGWIVEVRSLRRRINERANTDLERSQFISAPAIAGFMTGSAISICAGQVPGLMGFSRKFECVEARQVVAGRDRADLPLLLVLPAAPAPRLTR